MRSLVQTVVLAMLPSPGTPKTFSNREIAKLIGLSEPMYRRALKAVSAKRAALEGIHTQDKSAMFSQVIKRRGWRKIDPELKAITHDYIRRYPNIITSPIKGDTVTIKDPTDQSKTIKVPKLLRQISIRQLHNDLIKNVPECTKAGKVLISDTNLRANMPQEVKPMSDRYKRRCVPASLV